MEKFRQLVQEANKAFETADHLAYMTYPIVKDIKLIIIIVENLYNALEKAMDAVLYYDRLYKRINDLPKEFNLRFDIFKRKSAPRYGISEENIFLINEIRSIVEQRKKSPIEFIRKDKLVIASNNFKVKTVDINKIKEYVLKTKSFIEKLNEIKKEDDRRFGR